MGEFHAPILWRQIPASRYEQMFNGLIPAAMSGFGFLFGEAIGLRTCRVSGREGAQTFLAFAESAFAGCFEADEPLTTSEFRALTLAQVLRVCVREAA